MYTAVERQVQNLAARLRDATRYTPEALGIPQGIRLAPTVLQQVFLDHGLMIPAQDLARPGSGAMWLTAEIPKRGIKLVHWILDQKGNPADIGIFWE